MLIDVRPGGDGARDRRSRAQRPSGRGVEGPWKKSGKSVSKRALKSPDTLALERRVSDALGLAVTVDHRGNGGVLQITIELDQPDDVLRRLSKN